MSAALGDMGVFQRWVYREMRAPWKRLLVSQPMNEMAAKKAYGPLLVGPAATQDGTYGSAFGRDGAEVTVFIPNE